MNKIKNDLLDQKADVFKALGHPSRVLMVEALRNGELCVCELQKIVGADMSTVSKHLSVLKNAEIVSVEKRGLNVYYSLKARCVSGFITCIESMLQDAVTSRSKALESCCTKSSKE